MNTSCLRLKLVELNFFASFNADDQRKFAFLTYLNKKKDVLLLTALLVYLSTK